MSKPDLTLENYEAVNAYLSELEINQHATNIGHTVLGGLIDPEISFDDGAEEAIAQALEYGEQLIIYPHHVSNADIPAIVALPSNADVLSPIMGSTTIIAKQNVSKRAIARSYVEAVGGIHQFRYSGPKEERDTPEVKSLEKAAAISTTNLAIERMRKGNHLVMFVGSRVLDPTKQNRVPTPKAGIFHIVDGLDDNVKANILRVGIAYRNKTWSSLRRPFMHLGKLLPGNFKGKDSALADLQNALQETQDRAAYAKEINARR